MLHTKLLNQLNVDYPHIQFEVSDDFLWSASSGTLTFDSDAQNAELYILHELAHAILGHADFMLDIELIAQEREAWEKAKQLAAHYNVAFDTQLQEEALDTYRDWLHNRSLCPQCKQTGIQTKTSTYSCINCGCSWRPNDARRCALRRYRLAA